MYANGTGVLDAFGQLLCALQCPAGWKVSVMLSLFMINRHTDYDLDAGVSENLSSWPGALSISYTQRCVVFRNVHEACTEQEH
jgi:hypothetical protein